MAKEVISSIEEVYGRMMVTHGDVHEYVRGGGLDFKYLRNEKVVKFFMKHHLEEVPVSFTGNITKTVNSPAATHIFEVNDKCTKLSKKNIEIFHSVV